MKVFDCWVCQDTFPDMYQHVHHKVPRALGGRDHISNLVTLCPGCHDALHKVAYKLLSKKESYTRTLDIIKLIYKDNQIAKERCLELAMKVRDSQIVSAEKGLDPDTLVSASTVMTKQQKGFLVERCRELKTTQDEYIRNIIFKDLHLRYPNFDAPQEHRKVKSLKAAKGGKL